MNLISIVACTAKTTARKYKRSHLKADKKFLFCFYIAVINAFSPVFLRIPAHFPVSACSGRAFYLYSPLDAQRP